MHPVRRQTFTFCDCRKRDYYLEIKSRDRKIQLCTCTYTSSSFQYMIITNLPHQNNEQQYYLHTTITFWSKEALTLSSNVSELPLKEVDNSCAAIGTVWPMLGIGHPHQEGGQSYYQKHGEITYLLTSHLSQDIYIHS